MKLSKEETETAAGVQILVEAAWVSLVVNDA